MGSRNHNFISSPDGQERILVVDDFYENLVLIECILEDAGYDFISARSGQQALDLIEKEALHLILLDFMMPEMDGFEVTKRIRENPALPFIPILLMTAHDQPSAVKGLDLGADDFIRKPLDIDELQAKVRSLLRLKHSVDQLEQMSRMREDFVFRLTHDLRIPLMAAERLLELMQQEAFGELPQPMQEALATMRHSNHNLLSLVNTLVEVYRYEAAGKTLAFVEVDLAELVSEVVQELSPLAKDKRLSLTLEKPEGMQFVVKGDRLELHRLSSNLVGNAIKFTDSGSVEVSLNNTPPWIVLSVRDTGPGISPSERQWLFDRFRSGSHRLSGSGLGLYLSRQIIESHQGTIDLGSEPGKGSIFIVRLPVLAE